MRPFLAPSLKSKCQTLRYTGCPWAGNFHTLDYQHYKVICQQYTLTGDLTVCVCMLNGFKNLPIKFTLDGSVDQSPNK